MRKETNQMKVIVVCCSCKDEDILFEDKRDERPDSIEHDLCDDCRKRQFGEE